MKNLTLILIITVSRFTFTQWTDNSADKTPLDINTKAQELGISTEQLSGILNSASGGNGEEDPLPDALTERFFTGQAEYDQFGYSVSSAGDVNGDGYDDIIVGANLNSSARGKAYLYFGGILPDYFPDAIFSASTVDAQFGFSVSSAGDVNADGYADIIVGAPYDDATAGRATIIFGNPTMITYSYLILFNTYSTSSDDNFGMSVSGAGDVNGDGYSDVIVGAPRNDLNGTDVGTAFIFYGGSSMDAVADVVLLADGPGSGAELGRYVSKAGDINGDGYGDVIVSAPGDAIINIYLGSANMNGLPDLQPGGEIGSYAGDVNGDGFSDIIIGWIPNVRIYFGSSTPDITADVTLTGTTPDYFGSSVATAGDVNGDGFDDVIVGAYLNDAGGTDAGRAYVYFGGETMDNVKDVILTGSYGGDLFGFSVSGAGDFNGDGYDDILVGAPLNDAGGTGAGRAYIYLNSLTGPDIPDEIFTGEYAYGYLGHDVSSAGDVNGDGYSDLIISQWDAGRALIYFGGPLLDNTADLILMGESGYYSFGYTVSSAGDVNGDGYDDVLSYGGHSTGIPSRVNLYYGGLSMDNIADLIMTAEGANDIFGYAVSSAGDVNGDGFADVIIGAYGYSSYTGRAYIYYGGSGMDTTADIIMTGEAQGDYFGYSVSSAGDVNGDGFSDVIVGAYTYSSYTGRAYIYFGGSSMNNVADVILTGTTGDYLGISVSTAGDVNGDGFSDVLVGATGYNSNTGRAYIYYGGSSMDNTADVIMTGQAADDYFGISVSTSGDVNRDSYNDIIVGAQYNDANGANAGRAYIYYGGPSMDNTADLMMTGAVTFDNFGWSVSTAGDVNGDGNADVIVGAPYNDAGGNEAGRAYLYLSSSPPIKPRIMSVKDVPFDQGGQVFVNFVRSGYDAVGESNIITEYLIELSNPPGVNGFSWWQAGTVQPVQNPLYTFIANTPNDSMTNNSGTYYFRITARTADPNEYWRSNIMYGHSVDNLAPLPPGAFYAQLNGSEVHLGWQANLELDFRDYYIYRSDTPVLDNFTLIGSTTDTTFIDNSPISGNAYYYVQAYDVHDNGSALAGDSVMAFLSANIKVFLEGPYVGGQMSTFLNASGFIPSSQPFNTSPWFYTGTESVTSIPANVTDWILVELRSTTTIVVDRRAAFIKNDGTLVDLDGASNIKFPTATAGDYYVVIIHRNHLSVMTKDPVTISFSPTFYDMTDINNAYGTNAMKDLGGGYYGVYTADTDGSGTVNAADRSNTWNQRNLSGYYGTDVDLSGTVNAADRSVVWNNRNISAQVPAPVDGPVTKIVKGGSDD